MNHENFHEFDKSMNQLILMLKKLLKNLPEFPGPISPNLFSGSKDSPTNINLCFFTFLPMSPEDFEEMEEAYEQYLSQEEAESDFSKELTPQDLDFLRRHGIRF